MKSRKSIFLLIPFLLFSIFVNAQNQNDRENIKKQTNLQALQSIVDRSNNVNNANKAKIANQKVPLTKTTADGRLGVFYSFNEKGEAIYAYDDNVDAAASGRTNKIWAGGSSGLNLTGAGIEIGVWESGYARPSHQEFGGRASNGGDGGSVTSHGTHTGGTLIASGTDPAARGMASGATIKNYTASGMVTEAASFAAAGGILANNSNTPSGSAGVYDATARDMDEVTHNAPFYLHCKSAGNSGNNYGVVKTNQLAKNLLVVGNCNDVLNYTGPSSVSMSSSSSYGPSDDWRIKPDITNNGTTVYSSDSANNTDYGTKSGTSMSTPATAGTIALLQEHYKNINGVYMRAATAKGLIIDTADEMGANDGPDFASGWGLVNAERAAQVITNNGNTSIMDELTLNNGSTYTRTIISNGSTPLALTIVWNDPAGAIGSGNTPVLVNDLDVRVTGNNTTYSPWVMVPNGSFNNYTDPAQKGDNFRDNVEKIDAVLTAGTYTVTVTHKGTLTNGSQDFSLIVNGVVVSADTQAPSAPANLAASNIGATTADLSWAASTDNIGVTGYEIFQGGSSIGTSTTTSFNVTGLTASTAYSFTVKAKDAAGNVSGNSNVANITTTATPACAGISSFPYSESFESGLGVWTNATGDDIDWTRDSGGTPSNGTGPASGQDGSFYLYTEASTNVTPAGSPNKVALLNSPCIDLTGVTNTSLEFGYHMQGTAMGNMEVLASTDNGVTYTSIWSKNGSQGDVWNQATVALTSYSGSVIKLQFKATTGSGWSSDIAIDNIKIISTTPDTQAPSAPASLAASNIGATTADLSWTASTDNIGVTGYEIFQGGSSIGTSTTTSFNVTGLTASTAYSFTVKAKDAAGNVSGNSNVANITTTATPACAGISSFPYSESFESGIGVWTNATGDDIDWTRDSGGTPSNGTGPASGQDGSFYLYTEASTNVTPAGSPNKVALLNSPCIDLTGVTNTSLEFGYHMQGTAMGNMEVLASTDDGVTYTSIWSKNGSQGDVWNQATVALTSYSGSVIKLQFKATTGSGWSSDIAIDNIKIISTTPDTQAPSAPASLAASNIGATTADLSWTASTDNIGVTEYEIFQGGNSIGTSTTTSFNVTGLTASTAYSFTVKAKDAAGNVSGNSNVANITTTATPACAGISSFPYSESFESGIGVWTNATGDDIDWTRDSGGTPSNGTGPASGQDGSFYLYTEASTNVTPAGSPNKVAMLNSPCVDLTGVPNGSLEFGYHMQGTAMGNMEVLASTDDGVTYTSIWSRNGSQGDVWNQATVSLATYSGSVIKLQFKATTGSGWSSDIAIDNVKIISIVPDTQAPTVPTNLTASNIANTSVDLSWDASTDNTGVTGYDVYQDGASIGSSTSTTYSVSGLTANTTYSFTVRAKDAAGNVSANSTAINATTTNVVQYTLTTSTTGQGTVSGGGTYNSGTSVTVTATAASGWDFSGWSGALSGNTNPGSVTMNSDKTVTATFTESPVISTSTEKYRLTWRDNTSTTMVIGWNQVRGTNPVVHYGTTDFGSNAASYPFSKTVDRAVSSKGMNNNYARLTGLQADTAYYFVIKDSEGVSKRFWFKTAPSDPNTRLSIIAGGDSRNNRTPRQNANRLVAKIRPHAVLFGGDMTSSSSSSQWQNWFDDWQLTIGSDGRIIPVVAARGNHESSNDIRDLFDIPTAAGGEYYALSFGGNLMRTYTLNTEVTPAGTQGTWLANDLASNSANHTWAVAQYHRSTRPHEPGKSEQNDQYDAWSKPFYTHAVQLVMESDSHVVKRTWPIIPSTGTGSDEGFVRADSDPNRAIYVGEGCWGAPLRNASDTKNWTRAAGSFNQFKWLWIDKNKIELRTIKVDNASSVGQLSDNNLFVLPTNIDVWNPAGGSLVTIDNPHTIAAVAQRNDISLVDKNSVVEKKLEIHPNPIESGVLHIKYPNYTKANRSEAIIRDMFGRMVDKVYFKSETTTYAIDKLNAGVYFIVIKTRKGEESKKFIKR
ncbi:chitodextrinase [Aquimarina sp. EL_43]|uniref:fibronectin type III domain-containing protein n=1 Tax=unclassified Aquimarina TaxID=2627091 RepID=UPI001A1C43A9|nr:MULTISPECIES: fibronectin type III domain-containing protein [unclassified Aquimarina]MBG6130075.1 chitodextrinase [Aquimarina sp. EL_35]MBG6148855.1 chitodextrinase [Aquimarina sp. EL_32]MBG6168771.1 chitodextrinase [Aquimarina sp. EL_43]